MENQEIVTKERLTSDQSQVRTAWRDRIRAPVLPRRRWCWGTRLVVTASVAWLLFVVVHRLVSGRTQLWTLLDLLPPFLFVAMPAVLLAVTPLARPVRWRIMAVLVVAASLGAGLSGINLATLWYTPPPAPPGAISVVSWNTEFWDQDWRRATGRRFEAGFYDYLREFNADVYLLKEYLYVDISVGDPNSQAWTPEMALRIDKLQRLRREFPNYHIATSGEQITLSRLPIVAQRGLDMRPWLPEDLKRVPSTLADFPASYTSETLRTDIQVNNAVVSFYNTQIHQPPLDWRLYNGESRDANRYNTARREASYRALRADLTDNGHPAVLGADLNTTPAMGIRRLLPKKLIDHTRAQSSIYPTTWQEEGMEFWRIDWLLTTEDITVHRYELHKAASMSDHKAQRAVLSVPRMSSAGSGK
ncbi:MAG TPA: endonuclease/exonuclease/phosphatase family protein [Streptosporangiaceae bacterium]|jgi:hypothetical protein|nr:endonuclease/exonuclease/phosphatase family protein [Streptosporangiaceae bacterium]